MRKKLKTVIAGIMAITLTASGLYFFNNEKVEVKAANNYVLKWSDEFNGNALDTSVWSYDIGNGNWGWGNGEVEYYTDSTENVKVSDGSLQIIAKKQNKGNQQYTSGRIKTVNKKFFTYGKMEAKIKVENGNQKGVWPAYWMLGQNNASGTTWPNCGEIDIMEHANANNNVGGTLHWNYNGINGNYTNHGSYGSGDANSNYIFQDNTNNGINGWHTYGLIWDADHMEWQVDGITYFQQSITDNNRYCFTKDFFFIFNLALGGTGTGYTNYQTPDYSSFQTATMYVDYLRVYQLGDSGDTTTQAQTTKPSQTTAPQETETSIERVDAVDSVQNSFQSYFGNWAESEGTMVSSSNKTVTINASAVGNNVWGIQAFLSRLPYIAGNTYTYKCTINSDVAKKVRIKVVGDNSETDIFSMEDVSVQAGVPYNYEKQVTIPASYSGRLDLYFGLGGGISGDTVSSTSAMNLAISNVSFVTYKTNIIYKPITTTQEAATKPQTTTNTVQTTKKQDANNVVKTTNQSVEVKKPAKAKILKVKAKKKSITIKIAKIKKADGYQIRYSTSKKFKSYRNIQTFERNDTIKKLKSKKKYYIKVRAYILDDNGIKVYGNFSKVKKIKTK